MCSEKKSSGARQPAAAPGRRATAGARRGTASLFVQEDAALCATRGEISCKKGGAAAPGSAPARGARGARTTLLLVHALLSLQQHSPNMADGEQSVEELQKSLLEYQEQLSQVRLSLSLYAQNKQSPCAYTHLLTCVVQASAVVIIYRFFATTQSSRNAFCAHKCNHFANGVGYNVNKYQTSNRLATFWWRIACRGCEGR